MTLHTDGRSIFLKSSYLLTFEASSGRWPFGTPGAHCQGARRRKWFKNKR